MNKKWIAVLFALILVFSMTARVSAATDAFVYDEADVLSGFEEAELSRKLEQISHTYGAQLVVVTIPETSMDVDTMLDIIYDSMGFGYGEQHDGVMLMVCMDVREYRILGSGFAAIAVDHDAISAIGDSIVDDLSGGYYADAFHGFADQCAYYLDGHINGFPFDFGTSLFVSLFIGILVGVIVVFVMKSQLKSVRKDNQARAYIKPGSMNVTVSRDLFLYRNITRTRKESSSSGSRSGGGSRSRGGGSF